MLKLDSIVVRKFEELAEKAKKVNSSQQISDIAAVVDSKKFQDWANSALDLLQKVFGEESSYYRNFQSIYAKVINIVYKETFDNCRAILLAARDTYEGEGLADIKLFVDHAALEFLSKSTSSYLKRGEKETACILAAVLLEQAMKYLCRRFGISEGPMDEMNQALYEARAYQVGTQQRIKDWWYMKEDFIFRSEREYSTAEVDEMLRGVQKFIAKELAVKL